MISAPTVVLSVFCSVLGAVITVSIAARRRRDEWIREFGTLYRHFWNTNEMEQVRSWIANQEAYSRSLQPVLEKRLNGVPLSEAEYNRIEILDSFLSLMMVMVGIRDHLLPTFGSETEEVWNEEVWLYWIIRCYQYGKDDLIVRYMERHFRLLHKNVTVLSKSSDRLSIPNNRC